MISVVTSVNFPYWQKYGHRLAESFHRFVDPSIVLTVYHEAEWEKTAPASYMDLAPSGCIRYVDMSVIPGAAAFFERARPIVAKKIGRLDDDPDQRLANKSRDYLWDAVTFGKKAFALTHALATTRDYLFWMDADVVILKGLTHDFLVGLLDGRGICAFLRTVPHTECGFMGFDMGAIGVRQFAEFYSDFWTKGMIFARTDGWTDCHAFDAATTRATKEAGLKMKNLSTQPRGHVMAASPLAEYLDHQKGRRKQLGGSPESKW